MRTTRILMKSIPTCREYKFELACSFIELKNAFPKNRFSAAPVASGAAGARVDKYDQILAVLCIIRIIV